MMVFKGFQNIGRKDVSIDVEMFNGFPKVKEKEVEKPIMYTAICWLRPEAEYVELSGSNVIKWIDATGNGNDAEQYGGANTPTYVTSVINGLPVIRFNSASNQYLSIGTKLGKPANYTIFIVCMMTNTANTQFVWGTFDNDGSSKNSWSYLANRNIRQKRLECGFGDGNNYTVTVSDNNVFANDTYLLITQQYISGNNSVLLWNETIHLTTTNTTSNATSIAGTPYPFIIGKASGVVGGNLNGDIAELIIFDNVLGGNQMSNVHTYLKSKYNL